MIRKLNSFDIDDVMDIWLKTNMETHHFITADYWKSNYEFVKSAILNAEVYVYESDGCIRAFIGLIDNYIAGLFVEHQFQSTGIGSKLLSYAQMIRPILTLNVYEKNDKAVAFYKKHGFVVQTKEIETDTNHTEYKMIWERPEGFAAKEMRKIAIIGCPGSGKSTFARKLREITGLPLYYLDRLWHKLDKSNVSREEFDENLKKIVEYEKWIIDGNYFRTLEMRLKMCKYVFLLDHPLEVCLSGAESRIGKEREDMPWVETELDEEFRQQIVDFSKEQLPQIYILLEKYQREKSVVIFKSRKEADSYLKGLSKE